MSRDYKHRSNRRRDSRRHGISPWLGLIAGLMIGLFVAFLVFIRMQAAPQQQVFVRETLPAQDAPVAEDVSNDTKEVVPGPPKPRFDFYTLLPEMEVVVPEEEIAPPPAPAVQRPAVQSTPVTQPALG